MPTSATAEIVKVTAKVSDTLGITRNEEGSGAMSIAVGWQIAATITASTIDKFRYLNISTKTDTYTMSATEGANLDVIVCNKSSAMTVNLPAATGSGRIIHVKSINTGAVTIDGDSNDTIDGMATKVLAQWDSMMLLDYAANSWQII